MPSSVIKSYSYNKEEQVLRIVYLSGMIYNYFMVPQKVFDQMKSVTSKGKFLNEFIKGKYRFEKAGEE